MNNEIVSLLAKSGRTCGACSLCCKILPIDNDEEVNKQVGKWCRYCRPGKGGCGIYARRPDVCRKFVCMWLIDPKKVSEEWRPTKSKMVIYPGQTEDGYFMNFSVDAGHPDIWRKEPYYSDIKKWSLAGLTGHFGFRYTTRVFINNKHFIILPDKEVELDDKPWAILPVGDDKWDVMRFKDKETAKRFIEGFGRFLDHVETLSIEERTKLANEILAMTDQVQA